VAALLLVATPQAHGQISWSTSSGDWSVPGNWLGSLTPTSTDDAYIANGGTATITISDSAAVCNTLWLGNPNSANSGTIQMNNGSLSSGTDQNVGNLGTGTFLQSGGTNNGANNLNLGNNPGSLGIYSLSNSGMLNVANSENLGVSGTGTFTQLGGVNNAAGLTLGSNSGSIGTYTLSGTGTLNVTNSEYLGLSGTGTFNQLGGVNNAGGLTLCANSGSIGTYTLSGTGVLNATNQEFVGLSGTGTFIQSGGTNNANLGFQLGFNPGSSGSYSLSNSGVLNVPATFEFVGSSVSSGSGTFTHSGGTNNVGSLYVGYGASSGSYNLSGSGVLNASSLSVGSSGTSTFTQSGGTSAVTAAFSLSGGTYNLNAGLLSVPNIQGTGGTFNFSGGTLLTNSPFNTSQTMTLNGSGSVTVNTGGNAVAFSGALSGSGGLNVLGAGNLTLAGSNNYSGAVSIPDSTTLTLNNAYALPNSTLNLSASTSFLAFNTNGGTITTFNLGALAGSGSGTLTDVSGFPATLSAGGDGASTTFSGALSGSGGLTKTGSGILDLVGTNSYAGPTTINGGEIKLDFSHSASAPYSNIIYSNTANAASLVLGGGTLAVQGRGSTADSQLVYGLVINPGASSIIVAPGVSGTMLLSMGSISRSVGGTVDFTPPGGANSATNGILTTTSTTNGILGAYATTGGTGWAVSFGTVGYITALSTSAYTSGNLGTLTTSASQNLLLSGTQAPVTSPKTMNTLNLTGSSSLTMTGTGAVTLAGGGLIGNTTGTISGGTLEGSSGTLGELIVITPQNLTIASVLANNGSTATAFTKTGSATLTLIGTNTYTGATTIGAGALQLGNGTASGALGTGPVNDYGALVFNFSGNQSFANAISGAGSLTQAGSGLLTLTGSNTSTGPTTISSGTLQFGGSASLGGAGNVLDNGSLVFNRSAGTTFSGAISGGGNLSQIGSGVLTLLGNNTYSGATTISAGTLQIDNGTASGTLGSGPVTDNSVLVFDRSDNPIFNGVISGGGSLVQAGTGLLTVTGSNVYTGGTTISAGTLQVGNGNATAALGPGTLTDNSALVFNLSGAPAFGGAISGSGSLIQAGTGVLTLLGSNTYSGSTTISAGTLQVGNGGSGAAIGNSNSALDNGSLVFYGSDNPTFSGAISGSGNLTQAGTGRLTLLGSNTYTGATAVSAGTLQVGNGGSGAFLASPIISLSNSAALVFNHSDALTYSGLIAGTGSLTQAGLGILTLPGSNTYTGGTTILAGTLQVGNGGSGEFLASPSVSLSSGAALVFSQSDAPTYSGIISGSGNLTQAGPGLLTLLGSNTYSGSTTISGGTLQVGNGGSGASIGGSSSLLNNGSLVFSGSDNPTFGGAISGSGDLTQAGSGVLTLLGSNTYAGNTTISAGTLQLGNGGSGASIGNTNSVLDNSSLVFFHSDGVTFLPAISGSGNLTQAGSGVLTLLGNNTYSGSTTVSGGTLQVGNGGSGEFLASPSVSLSNSAALVFNQSDVQTYGGVISGVGNVTLTGTGGLLTLLGSNTYTGNTTVSGGTLQIGSGGSGAFLASPSVSLSNSAALVFSQSDSQIYGGVISGSGNVMLTGSGLLTLLGSNTYSGTTTISGGTLQVGNGIAAATLGTGAVTDNSALVFNLPGASTFGGAISGKGSLTLAGTGLLTLLGSNTFTGGTMISTGTLQLGNGGTSGSLTSGVALGSGGALVLDRADNVSMNFTLSGPGGLWKTGSDTVTLTGNSTSFTGPVSVVQGQLVLAGPANIGATTVSSGGTLQFSGASFNLGFTGVSAQTGGLVQFQSANISGGYLAGLGKYVLAGSTATTFNSVTNYATLQQNGPAVFNNVINDGLITASGGLQLVNGKNDISGVIILSGTNTVSQWGGNQGLMTIQGGSLLNNENGPLTSAGGGVITINSGGTLNADSFSQGASLNLRDSLLINNGTVIGTTNVGYGATASGSGSFGLINLSNSGAIAVSPAASPQSPGVVITNGLIVGSGVLAAPATIAATATVMPNANLTLTLAGNLSGTGQLIETGSGKLVLSGSNTYSGGTDVYSGTLEVINSNALANGTNLTIDAGDKFIFPNSVAEAPAATVNAVPEPGTLALLSMAGIIAAAAACRRRRICSRENPSRSGD
jgi:autotransporter-associated beta strand protein